MGADKYKGAGLAVQWVEVEGPLIRLLAAGRPSPHLRRLAVQRTAGNRWETTSKTQWPMPSDILRSLLAAPSVGG